MLVLPINKRDLLWKKRSEKKLDRMKNEIEYLQIGSQCCNGISSNWTNDWWTKWTWERNSHLFIVFPSWTIRILSTIPTEIFPTESNGKWKPIERTENLNNEGSRSFNRWKIWVLIVQRLSLLCKSVVMIKI